MTQISTRPGQHVIPAGRKWAVRKAGTSRATIICDTRQEAVEIAQSYAERQRTAVYVHAADGRIEHRQTSALSQGL